MQSVRDLIKPGNIAAMTRLQEAAPTVQHVNPSKTTNLHFYTPVLDSISKIQHVNQRDLEVLEAEREFDIDLLVVERKQIKGVKGVLGAPAVMKEGEC